MLLKAFGMIFIGLLFVIGVLASLAVLGAQVSDNQAEDAPSGEVRGYDAVTGELRWAWDLGNPGVTTEPAEGEG